MSPILVFALALLGADESPAATAEPAAPPAAAAPAATPAPAVPAMGSSPVSPPTDDYGYVAWCYGAISAYVELYDRAMPEVIRIERAWPTPSTEENINEVYPGQKKESIAELKLFERAMTAAEKASVKPIQQRGAAAIKRGRAVWSGADQVTPAQLAQFWMSWSPPAKCEETARNLEKKAKLMGQALTYNTDAEPEEAPAPPADAAGAAGDQPVPALTLAPAPEGEPQTEPTAEPAAAEPTSDEAKPAEDAPAPDDATPATEPGAILSNDPEQPTLDAPLEPQVEIETKDDSEKTAVPDVIAPAPDAKPAAKGDTASPTGFKPRKKKPELRGRQ